MKIERSGPFLNFNLLFHSWIIKEKRTETYGIEENEVKENITEVKENIGMESDMNGKEIKSVEERKEKTKEMRSKISKFKGVAK